jgi:very-short-patch-repair endonuclease
MNPVQVPRLLRKNSTQAESKLWRLLRGRKFSSYKFRRQHRIGEYVLDFFCPEARYNIELDGSGHGFPAQRAEDEKRDAFLMERNIKVRRFWNNQLKEIKWVRETVWADLQARAPHPDNEAPKKQIRLAKRTAKIDLEKQRVSSHPSPSVPLPIRGEG